MPYGQMYALLFNKITDIIEELQEVQRQAEEIYIENAPEMEKGRGLQGAQTPRPPAKSRKKSKIPPVKIPQTERLRR